MNKMTKIFLILYIFVGMLNRTPDVQGLNISGLNLQRIRSKLRVKASLILGSRYFVPVATLAAVLAAGIVGYKLSSYCSGKKRERKASKKTNTDKGYTTLDNIQLGSQCYLPGRGILVPSSLGVTHICVQQAQVLNQFGWNGGGVASCGYQALKNACAITSMLLGIDRRDWLTSSDIVQQLFGPGSSKYTAGRWRSLIMQHREQQVLCYYFASLMPIKDAAVDVKGECNYKSNIRGLFVSFAREYVQEIVGKLYTHEKHIEMSANAFVAWVQARPIVGYDPTRYGENLTAHDLEVLIHNRETILAHIAIDETQIFDCSLDMLQKAQAKYNNDVRGKFNTISFDGEWLGQGEVELLIPYAKQHETHLKDIPVFVCDSMATDELDFISDVTELRQAIKEGKSLPHPIYAFVLGNMHHDGDQIGSDGHWTTLVLDTLENNQRRYTLADSDANPGHLSAGACQKFICYLEGEKIGERIISASKNRKPRAVGWLSSLYNRCKKLLW